MGRWITNPCQSKARKLAAFRGGARFQIVAQQQFGPRFASFLSHNDIHFSSRSGNRRRTSTPSCFPQHFCHRQNYVRTDVIYDDEMIGALMGLREFTLQTARGGQFSSRHGLLLA